MKKHIPNIITSLNLFMGVCACIVAIWGKPSAALLFIIAAAIFDFLDGFFARLLNAYSNIGKELDSLADNISFGVAPSLVLFNWCYTIFPKSLLWLSFVPLLIAVFSALRLAKFNLDTRQSTVFLGLPTPANALAIVSIIAFAHSGIITGQENLAASILSLPWVIPVFSIILCLLLVSELPMFSMKFKSFGFKENSIRYIFLMLCTIIVIVSLICSLSYKLIIFFILTAYLLICLALCLAGALKKRR